MAIVWALIGAPEHGWASAQTIGSLTVGVVLLAALAMTERRVAHPMLVPALLRDRRRLGALAVTTLVFGSQIATSFLVVQYVQRVLHFGPIAAGAAFLPMTLGIFAMARIAPKLVARFGQKPLLITGNSRQQRVLRKGFFAKNPLRFGHSWAPAHLSTVC
ncbi:hypothetical protein ACSHXN_47190 (plasmid) [Streptomyces sp. HUAS TT11]|uniref:hypothetical protein n=1 Tax=Streptomyces sp. HUAS TT11 TaxID=3447508 RepID=UPI003F65CFD0